MIRISALTAACLAAAALPASAALVQAEWTGTIDSGSDSGVFGVNGDLTGETVTMTFIYDTDLGTYTSVPGQQSVVGGYTYGTTDPMVSATVTIGGESFTTGGSNNSYAYYCDITVCFEDGYGTTAYDSYVDPVTGVGYGSTVWGYTSGSTDYIMGDLTTPFTVTDLSGATAQGYFETEVYDPSTGQYVSTAWGSVTMSSLTVSLYSPAAPVPLPASAWLILGGFGTLFGLKRWRRRPGLRAFA